MRIEFTKMHGCANDYIYINNFDERINNPSVLAKVMSPRHFSVGADGLVLICKSDVADAKMRMFNLDGSEGLMCGNAIRCVAKYLCDNDLVGKKDSVDIETLSGIKHIELVTESGVVVEATVEMGQANFQNSAIPLSLGDGEEVPALHICDKEWKITTVSMGNPHAVTLVDNVSLIDIEKIGPQLENNELFPERVNTEFIEVIDETHLKMRVWERGSGETYACGTGACGSVAACVKNGICPVNTEVVVELLGGNLFITVDEDFNVKMRGPAKKVYEGVFEYED